MNRLRIWIWLSVKRQLKRPALILILVLAPLALLALSQAGTKDSGQVAIALYSEDTSLAPEVMGLLVEEDGIFDFYVSPSEEALREDVAARRAECGYMFGSELKEKLDSGTYKRAITVVTAPSTVLAELSMEVVYSRLIDVYGRDILKAYSESLTFLPKEERWRQLEPLYDRYLTDGSTFSFRYETAGEVFKGTETPADQGDSVWQALLEADSPQEESSLQGAPVISVRGMISVGIFILGLFSAAWLARDEESGLFAPIPEGTWTLYKGITAGAPVALAGISGLAALGIMEQGRRFWLEAILMALYVCLVTGVSMAMEKIFRRTAVLLGQIPFLSMAALVVCPVFVDLAPFVPAIRLVRWLFVPFYYLWVCGRVL